MRRSLLKEEITDLILDHLFKSEYGHYILTSESLSENIIRLLEDSGLYFDDESGAV